MSRISTGDLIQEAMNTMFEPSPVYMTRRTRLCIIAMLFMMTAVSTAYADESLPIAKIMSVESPPRVSPGEAFAVQVAVDYSDRYSTDIAILDVATGFVLASKGLIIPAGRNLFTFSLTGPDNPGTWSLLATVRVWFRSGWYASQEGNTFRFDIMVVADSNVATLNLRSNAASAVVGIDGISHVAAPGGLKFSGERGFHKIEAEPLIDLGNGTRLVFDHWNDGARSPVREMYLAGRLDLFAAYSTEYFLAVESNLGETVGSGWYREGMNATFAALEPPLVERSFLGLHPVQKFSHWSGDSESVSVVSWVVMDRPKTVAAHWSEDSSQITRAYSLLVVSLAFLSCSTIIVAMTVALTRRKRGKASSTLIGRRRTVAGLLLVLFFSATIAGPSIVSSAHALTLLQPESVAIGDATWYHWNQSGGDTCLIWLGGGFVEQTGFIVNPYEFESYNTVYFIQDLARHYDVLALKKGSTRVVDETLNRTIFGERYPGSNNFMKNLRAWADLQGYTYLYVVGYSVGAMVAAQELVLANPTDWASPNGLIIITTKIPQPASSKANSLRASLLLLYGGKVAPEFTTSGQSFFQNAPQEGWLDQSWYHKEFHLIPDVEHEVWTVYESGEYDNRAVLLTVKFIETTKSLQFQRVESILSRTALNVTEEPRTHSSLDVEVTSVDSPSKVRIGEVFRVNAVVRYDLASNMTLAIAAFDADKALIVSAAKKAVSGSGRASFPITILSGSTAALFRFLVIPLVATNDGWVMIESEIRIVLVEVADSYALTVVTGYPKVPVRLDNVTLETGADGRLTMNAAPGEHLISVPSTIAVANATRLVFQQWNGTLGSADLHLTLSHDVTAYTIYRRQHYLSVNSLFGQTAGTGWYDENATASFSVTPSVVIEKSTHVFAGWSGDVNDSSPVSRIFMNSQKSVRGSWSELEHTQSDASILKFQVLFTLSSITLLASCIFAVVSVQRSKRYAGPIDTSPDES